MCGKIGPEQSKSGGELLESWKEVGNWYFMKDSQVCHRIPSYENELPALFSVFYLAHSFFFHISLTINIIQNRYSVQAYRIGLSLYK